LRQFQLLLEPIPPSFVDIRKFLGPLLVKSQLYILGWISKSTQVPLFAPFAAESPNFSKILQFSSWILNRNFWDSHGQLLTQRASCILRSGGPATSFGKCDHFQVSKDFSMDIWDADAADGDGTWWYPAGNLQYEDQAFCSGKKTYAENEKRWPPYVLLVYSPNQLVIFAIKRRGVEGIKQLRYLGEPTLQHRYGKFTSSKSCPPGKPWLFYILVS
jgi:hypothetical protein